MLLREREKLNFILLKSFRKKKRSTSAITNSRDGQIDDGYSDSGTAERIFRNINKPKFNDCENGNITTYTNFDSPYFSFRLWISPYSFYKNHYVSEIGSTSFVRLARHDETPSLWSP
jgi:hypothetical protein